MATETATAALQLEERFMQGKTIQVLQQGWLVMTGDDTKLEWRDVPIKAWQRRDSTQKQGG